MGWQSLRPNPKPTLMLLLMLGMDTMVMDADGEDIMDTHGVDITDTTEARGLLMLKLNLLLLLKPILRLMPLLMPGTDTTDIPDTTDTDMVLDTTDTVGVDITDTPTPGLTVITTLERDLLMPNPRLRPNPRLKPNPGIMAVGVDTMAILMLTGDITDTDMAVVTGGKL